MKLCKDCRHHEASPLSNDKDNFDKCRRLDAVWATLDLVRGNHSLAHCQIERTCTSRDGACGKDAKHWEPVPSEFTPGEEDGNVSF